MNKLGRIVLCTLAFSVMPLPAEASHYSCTGQAYFPDFDHYPVGPNGGGTSDVVVHGTATCTGASSDFMVTQVYVGLEMYVGNDGEGPIWQEVASNAAVSPASQGSATATPTPVRQTCPVSHVRTYWQNRADWLGTNNTNPGGHFVAGQHYSEENYDECYPRQTISPTTPEP